jgi:hypothetical protein
VAPGATVDTFFTLDQFGYPQYPVLEFRTERAGVLSGYTNYSSVGLYNATGQIATCNMGDPLQLSWRTGDCSTPSPYHQQFNYAGGWNRMAVGITNHGSGEPLDQFDVNWLMLTITECAP